MPGWGRDGGGGDGEWVAGGRGSGWREGGVQGGGRKGFRVAGGRGSGCGGGRWWEFEGGARLGQAAVEVGWVVV